MSGRRPYPPPEPLDPHTLAAQQRRQDRLEARVCLPPGRRPPHASAPRVLFATCSPGKDDGKQGWWNTSQCLASFFVPFPPTILFCSLLGKYFQGLGKFHIKRRGCMGFWWCLLALRHPGFHVCNLTTPENGSPEKQKGTGGNDDKEK